MGTGPRVTPGLGSCCPALTLAGVRPWCSHRLLSCSLHHGPIGFPTGPQLRGHVRLHSGPVLPGVRLLPRASDRVLELRLRDHLPVRPAVLRALFSQQHGNSAFQPVAQ